MCEMLYYDRILKYGLNLNVELRVLDCLFFIQRSTRLLKRTKIPFLALNSRCNLIVKIRVVGSLLPNLKTFFILFLLANIRMKKPK